MKPTLVLSNLASASLTQRSTLIGITPTVSNLLRQYHKNGVIFNGHTSLRTIYTRPHLRNQQQKDNELPKFSFEGLGMSKNVRIFVIAVLSIFGTIETWVWCKGIYRWWNGRSEEEKKRIEGSRN